MWYLGLFEKLGKNYSKSIGLSSIIPVEKGIAGGVRWPKYVRISYMGTLCNESYIGTLWNVCR